MLSNVISRYVAFVAGERRVGSILFFGCICVWFFCGVLCLIGVVVFVVGGFLFWLCVGL